MSNIERADTFSFGKIFQPRSYIVADRSITSETKEEAEFMLSRDCRFPLLIAQYPIVGGKNDDGSVTFTLSKKGRKSVEKAMQAAGFKRHQVEEELQTSKV